jgi:hypothetical protein
VRVTSALVVGAPNAAQCLSIVPVRADWVPKAAPRQMDRHQLLSVHGQKWGRGRMCRMICVLLGVCILIANGGVAFAASRSEHCVQWNRVCLSTCTAPTKAECTECTRRLAGCKQNGCYFFNNPGPRCDSDPVRACSDWFQDCMKSSQSASVCEGAKAACMKTGRWVRPRDKIDIGPAHKR